MKVGITLCVLLALGGFGLFMFGTQSPYFLVGIFTLCAAAVIAVGIIVIYYRGKRPRKRRQR